MLKGFIYSSTKHQRESELLDNFNQAVFLLKLETSDELTRNRYTKSEAKSARDTLRDMLSILSMRITALTSGALSPLSAMPAYTAWARRFVEVNPADVADRLAYFDSIQQHLMPGQEITERDFSILNRLQGLLEGEISREIHSLFAF